MMTTTETFLLFYWGNQIASAFIQALPPPNGNQWYNFFYRFAALLIADFKTFSNTYKTETQK